jgi:uncharacterized membrane protein SpoIIM required for sporulation
MNQHEFEARHRTRWEEFERHLSADASLSEEERAELPFRYRQLCHQLAIARGRLYSLELVDRLERLALRAHHQLYGQKRSLKSGLLYFLLEEFPGAIRRHVKAVLVALTLFFLPALIVGVWGSQRPEWIYAVLGEEGMQQVEKMYDPNAAQHQEERDVDLDVLMFGFYIEHNISIGLQCFATGLFAGIGSLFALIYNGVFLGAVSVYIHELGYGETFFPFVIGHGAFELPAIALMGAAGIEIGWALLCPGRARRGDALRWRARSVLPLVLGATAMLLIAALIEAFWSPRHAIPPEVKYLVGTVLWLLVAAHWLLAFRQSRGG